MRAQVRPRSSQVPRPMSGMRAPCASMNRADIFYLALGLISLPSVSIIPARRVRRVDDTHTSLFEAGGFGHFRLPQTGDGKSPIWGGDGGGWQGAGGGGGPLYKKNAREFCPGVVI